MRDCTGSEEWPQRGVYFFFDHTEPGPGPLGLRVVRVGTHALKVSSKKTLWGRLRDHRGTVGGARPGGGNHRGSVFRHHVGLALINKEGHPRTLRHAWESDDGSAVGDDEHTLECAVSRYVRDLPFLWVEVPDPPGRASNRGVIEAGAIALLSACPQASTDWLGRHAEAAKIRSSGLWNVNHIEGLYDRRFLDALSELVCVSANYSPSE